MKRTYVVCATIVVFALVTTLAGLQFSGPNSAIEQMIQQPCNGHQVLEGSGDTLWALSGINGDPNQFHRFLSIPGNAFLLDRGPIFRDGKEIFILKPGDCIYGVDDKSNNMAIGQIPEANRPAATPAASPSSTPQTATGSSDQLFWLKLGRLAINPLMWLIVFLLGLLVYWLVRRIFHANPVTSGQPIVSGGIQNTEQASSQFQQVASERWHDRYHQGYEPRQFTIIRQTRGRGFGPMLVNYRDSRPMPRVLNGETVYKAVVRNPDGTEEELFMLQGCGNDLRYLRILGYQPGPEFRFVPDEEAAETPAQVAQPQSAAVAEPASEPTAEVLETSGPEEQPSTGTSDENILYQVQYSEPTEGHDSGMLRVKGIEVSSLTLIKTKDGETTIRFKPAAQPKRVRKPKPATTGTGTEQAAAAKA